jgi:hypothetical protein
VLLGVQDPAASRSANSTAEASVMLSEQAFSLRPFEVGHAVQLLWAPEAAHSLLA